MKKEIIKLLKEDEEFRYTVAGLIGLEEILRRLDRIEEEQRKLREDFNSLREDFNSTLAEIKSINIRLGRLERTVEKLTVDVEEEARPFVKYYLERVGIKVDLDVLKLPEAEINIYGVSDGWCVVGEASLRAGANLLDELFEKYKLLRERYPNLLRDKTILVLYVTLPLPELIKRAEESNVWLLKATKEYTKLDEIIKRIGKR